MAFQEFPLSSLLDKRIGRKGAPMDRSGFEGVFYRKTFTSSRRCLYYGENKAKLGKFKVQNIFFLFSKTH
jgi:hypothetical protein